MARQLHLTALDGIPEIEPGADLAAVTLAGLRNSDIALQVGDVLVVAQKIVSKAEGRYVDLATVTPLATAREWALICGKDPRVVELIVQESTAVMRCVPGLIVVRHRLGFVMANAGVDESNLDRSDRALLLPIDPDASCARLRAALRDRAGVDVGVVMNDSFGRAWRVGAVGTALGVSGVPGVVDLRGQRDRRGRALNNTEVALADELAAAASLIMGQAAEGTPIVHARGVPYARRDGTMRELLRPLDRDLFQ